MKYEVDIDINLSRDKVIALFDNVENLKHWQPGFVSFEPISGTPGTVGAKSRITYKMGKRDLEMIETITKRNFPEEFFATFETKGVYNLQECHFIIVDKNTTKWKSVNEFKCSGLIKLIAFLMPKMFKKESMKYMLAFKDFAEGAN